MTFFGPDIRNGLPISLGSMAGFGRRAFTPSVLFAAGEQGFWYDPSDLSSMYQDSAGTTPVTAVEQAVGLILDKSKGLVIGPELVTNGDFATNSDWTLEAGSTISGGALNVVAPGAAVAAAKQSVTFVPGRMYQITFTLTGSGTGLSINIPGASGISRTAAGTYTQFLIPTLTGELVVSHRGGTGWTGTVDNISVRELTGNHAIQPGATNRPILRSRYNLLTYSEEFDNAAWVKAGSPTVTANSTVAPDGTTTADTIAGDAGVASLIRQGFNMAAGTEMRVIAHLRQGTATQSRLRFFNSAITVEYAGLIVAWTAGVPSTSSTAGTWTVSPTYTSLGNGWYRVEGQFNIGAQTSVELLFYPNNANNTTTTIAWGFDLRRANDTYLPYQRIAAATDYDTVGFPVYLAFDGSDDSLYTGGNVDFSATDKMTVFAGVTKLSDAAVATLAELSASLVSAAFDLQAPSTNATPTYRFRVGGTSIVSASVNNAAYAAPVTNVIAATSDISGDSAILRADGVEVGSSTGDQGTGNFANAPLYIGRRNNASLPFNGRLFQLIGRGAATSAALLSQAERWVAGKQGRAL